MSKTKKLGLQAILEHLSAGLAVTVFSLAKTRAQGWAYASLRRDHHNRWHTKAPGERAWYRLRPLTEEERARPHAQAAYDLGMALASSVEGGNLDLLPSKTAVRLSVFCRECDEELTHPDSIAAGAGPACRGYYAELRKRKRERAERIASLDLHKLAVTSGAVPATMPRPTPKAVRCAGTCDIDEYCADCD